MVQLGYAISSEEFPPNELVRNAQQAEATGFPYALISDHFHPWLDDQGHGPLVWSVIGGIAQATSTLRIGTGVTCPTVRIHPAIIAQAAATSAAMLPGRFFLGVGSGEALNEHITGQHWPPVSVRLEMLREAVGVIRELWGGKYVTHHGRFYTVENARLYTLPDSPIEIHVAAAGPEAATLAGEIGDGLIDTTPAKEVIQAFDAAGGTGKPRYGQMTMCWAADDETAKKTAHHYWRYTVLPGQLSQELALPLYFDEGSKNVTPDQVAESVVCGPDPQKYIDKIQAFADAGFTHVYLHQVGPDQAGFFDIAKRELLPHFAG
jgi:G6PDH family F420-dependent oxidoreductase